MLPRTKKEVDAWLKKMLRDFCRDWAEKEEKLKKKLDIKMRTFAEFEQWAKGIGYVVERVGRRIEWYHKNNHSIIGVCSTIQQAKYEIISHYFYRPIT